MSTRTARILGSLCPHGQTQMANMLPQKDFCDLLRYFVLSAPTYLEEGSGVLFAGGGY